MLPCLVAVLFAFYLQVVLKFKCKIPASKGNTSLTTACVPVPKVEWKTLDDGQRNCPKHAELCNKINLEISASVNFIVKKTIFNISRSVLTLAHTYFRSDIEHTSDAHL